MLLIKNARLLDNGTPVAKNIYVDEKGKIRAFLNPSEKTKAVKADLVVNAKNNYVLPGLIDSHVHLREPGMEHKEDFFSGSKAAAAGGVTTFLDMPNTKPPTLAIKDLRKKRKLAQKSLVNFGFHFGSSSNNISEIKKAWQKENIASTKVFMNVSTGKMLIEDEKNENGKNILEDIFLNSRIVMTHAEQEKIEKAVEISNCTNTLLHLAHITLKSEMDFIKKTKHASSFSVEATPHHLFLTEKFFKKKKGAEKGFGKMFPCLKTENDRMALWSGIYNNFIDTIATDHAPHTIEEKSVSAEKAPGEIPGGVPGLETMLPLLLNEVNKCNLTLTHVTNLCAGNPAKIFKIKNKGLLGIGYDADLVIIDLKKTKTIKNENLFTKCKWSPFEGMKLKGWPIMTIVKGNIVFDGENIISNRGDEVEFGN